MAKFKVEVAHVYEDYKGFVEHRFDGTKPIFGEDVVIKDEVFNAVVFENHFQWSGSSDLVKFLNKNDLVEPNGFNEEPFQQVADLLNGRVNEVYLIKNFEEVFNDDDEKVGEQYIRTVITRVE